MNAFLRNKLTSVELYIEQAQLLEQENKIKDAIALCQQAIKVYPRNYRLYYELGILLTKSKSFTEAIIYYQQAINLNPQWFKPYYNLGQIATKENNLELAINYYQQVIKLKADYPWSYFNLGNIYFQLNKLELAIIFYQQAIKNHSFAQSFYFYLALGNVYLQQNRINLALDCYQKCLKINPHRIEAQLQLGLAYSKKYNWQQAIASYNQVIKTNPHCFLALFSLGEIFRQQNSWENAIANYHKALKIKPNDVKTFQRLQTCLAQQSPEKYPDYQAYQLALADEVQDKNFYYQLGKKLSKQGLIETAIDCYLKVIEIDPQFLGVYETIYNSILYLDNCDRIIEIYQKTLNQYPNILTIKRNLGKIFLRQGNQELAIKYNQQVAQAQIKSIQTNFSHKEYLSEPNFLIIGSEKCGTSSLYQYIVKHPHVVSAIEKEIHFFTYNFAQGLDWYRSHFSPLPLNSKYITGEASTSYIACHNNAPQRVVKLFPQIKLLAVIRNPIDRAISHYHQLVRLGKEYRSLEEIIQIELEILKNVDDIWSIKQKYWAQGKGILWHSLYVYFLQEWLNIFPRKQLLIIRSEDLFANTQDTMEKVFNFLELSEFPQQSYHAYNSGGKYNQLEESIVKQLEDFFAPHNKKLEDLIIRQKR